MIAAAAAGNRPTLQPDGGVPSRLQGAAERKAGERAALAVRGKQIATEATPIHVTELVGDNGGGERAIRRRALHGLREAWRHPRSADTHGLSITDANPSLGQGRERKF